MIKALKQIFLEKIKHGFVRPKNDKLCQSTGLSTYIGIPDISSSGPRDRFYEFSQGLGVDGIVLEVGTKQGIEGTTSHSQLAFPNVQRHNYIMSDVVPGKDVDVVANIHNLPSEWTGHFDCFVGIAVFEHLERPWIAAKEVARVLKKGGGCYVGTHQTFPLHGWPSDFFRFSDAALRLIFEDAGMKIIDIAYEHRTKIIPPENIVPHSIVDNWNADWPSYVIVHMFAQKM